MLDRVPTVGWKITLTQPVVWIFLVNISIILYMLCNNFVIYIHVAIMTISCMLCVWIELFFMCIFNAYLRMHFDYIKLNLSYG